MPSREFVEKVLSTGSANDEPEVELEDEASEEAPGEEEAPEEAEEEAEASEEESEPAEAAEGEEEGDDLPEEEDEEPEQADEPTSEQDDEFYIGNYRTREEAEQGYREYQQRISRDAEEMHQMRERMAQYEGYLAALNQTQNQSEPGEFEAWAEQYFEAGQAHAGFQEAMDATEATGDDSYVNAYVEVWKEHDPYEAAVARNRLDMVAAVNWQRNQPTPPPPLQEVANSTWTEVGQSDPELLQNGEYAQGVARILKNSEGLKALMLSGDPRYIREAISIARDGYRMAARTGNGTPRKMKASDAERLRKDKLAATVTTGDSAPERRASTPEVPQELQDMMQRISAGEGGFPKLRE